jgi:hypothetical protein
MIAAFGSRPKRRLNHVMDALNFEYPDYERLDEGAGGAKRKRGVNILGRQATRFVKEDQKASKKKKTLSEPKDSAPKKRKLVRISYAGTKVQDVPEKTIGPPSPSSTEVSKILKVMTESIPFALLSPLRLDLTSLLRSKGTAPSAEKAGGGRRNDGCKLLSRRHPQLRRQKQLCLSMPKIPSEPKLMNSQPQCRKSTDSYQMWLPRKT